METKRILGLDLGTNSIGWAVVKAQKEEEDKIDSIKCIELAGSRIIPMDAGKLDDFGRGNSISRTHDRTQYRGVRRMRERHLQRRERLLRMLSILKFIPQHFENDLDRYGKIVSGKEPRVAWEQCEEGATRFLFMESYQEMMEDLRKNHPDQYNETSSVPYDRTIYYLRKKALTQKISKEELTWLLLNFNQKRGYYQLRGEGEESDVKKKEERYYALKVVDVEETPETKGKDRWYHVILENGCVYKYLCAKKPDWIGKTKEFIITTYLDEKGNPKKSKEGTIKHSCRVPKEDDWNLLKKKTEEDIRKSNKTIGEYIYEALGSNPKQKIKGKLVRTVERSFYKEELKQIIETQLQYHPELTDRGLYSECINALYKSNEAHRNNIANKGFDYLFIEDILFYHRPLKIKKSLVKDCPYESYEFIDKTTGEIKSEPIKAIAKSHPLYQEFRLWQFISNLHFYQYEKVEDGKLKTDVNVTSEFLKDDDDRLALFTWLNDKKEITQEKLLTAYFKMKKPKGGSLPYRWNFVQDKAYPCNETRALLLSHLKKAGVEADFLTPKVEEELWHLLYSISDKEELKKALTKYAIRNKQSDEFIASFLNTAPFEREYGAYSLRATKKLLSVMRRGKYWSAEDIDPNTMQRIEQLIKGEYDETLRERLRKKAIHLTEVSQFSGLPLWLACYVVYNRHSEAKETNKWEKPEDIDRFLNEFQQHSLRNPIVEQIVIETLRTVRDIWKEVGKIDEIHIELGREMKKSAPERKRIAEQNMKNENTTLRVKAMLTEFLNPTLGIEAVRPYSPSHQELFRIYEEGALTSASEIPDEITSIIKAFNESDIKKRPSTSDVKRYKLWLEQHYLSPYTGKVIPLSHLFTKEYEIEHIIPKARFFDDSMSNKVICESAVNKLKDKLLGYEFIKKHGGSMVELGNGKRVQIFNAASYEEHAKSHFAKNRGKMKKLLLEDIPDDFIERQMNDSRYISKYVRTLLSNLVRDEEEQEAISKHVISCTGEITSKLKKDWGINDKWNKIILPRFERLNELLETTVYTAVSDKGHTMPSVPLSQQKGYSSKRLDHRHHAMDAIVIACTTRSHINLLNNECAKTEDKEYKRWLSKKLRNYKMVDKDIVTAAGTESKRISVADGFIAPWHNFADSVYQVLNEMVVTFKTNRRIISKSSNYYKRFVNGKKVTVKQQSNNNWGIRKPLHTETVYGKINLRKIKNKRLSEVILNPLTIVNKELKRLIITLLQLGYDLKQIKNYFEQNHDSWKDINLLKIETYYFTDDTKDNYFATRSSLNDKFNRKQIDEKVADTGIRKILSNHLSTYRDDPKLAFSPEGIEEMNRNIIHLNDGKEHQPIYKVRTYERADRFAVSTQGKKATKYVEAAKGTNLYYAVYECDDLKTGNKKRTFASIPLKEVIERLKQGLPPCPNDENGNAPIFTLSPNDLVYLPTDEQISNGIDSIDKERIYKFVSCTGNESYFLPHRVATSIIDKQEFSSMNKIGRAISGEMIKETCIPLKVDRLGKITII